MTVTKAQLREVVDRLPEGDLPAIQRVLDDPLLRALLSTPADDEPLTSEEITGIIEAEGDAREGRVEFTTVDELIRDLNADQR